VCAEHPRFETRVFARSPEVGELVADLPSVRRALFDDGVPKGFFGRRYSADPDLTILAWEGHAPVVRFGTSGLAGMIGIDSASGKVIRVIDVPCKPTILVNTTVALFTLTVRALIERFPYYAKDADDEEIDSVAEELREIIRSIDAEAAVPGSYWPAFVDDVQMGDFNTEDILASGQA
jgi:SUKH-4 immunity protein